jgi:Mn2+/Fe2+ NRAMP family transporter
MSPAWLKAAAAITVTIALGLAGLVNAAIASNLIAMVVQTLSAKLGIATGMNFAEHCRNEFPGLLVHWSG